MFRSLPFHLPPSTFPVSGPHPPPSLPSPPLSTFAGPPKPKLNFRFGFFDFLVIFLLLLVYPNPKKPTPKNPTPKKPTPKEPTPKNPVFSPITPPVNKPINLSFPPPKKERKANSLCAHAGIPTHTHPSPSPSLPFPSSASPPPSLPTHPESPTDRISQETAELAEKRKCAENGGGTGFFFYLSLLG